MNGRCHNDPMDFATEVCDSCGDPFCANCLVYPRGTNKPPFCTNCAMALSGVRNRRPVKPLPRGEIKKRRKKLKAELADQDTAVLPDIHLPMSDLIEAPQVETEVLPASVDSTGFMGRFRRRKTDPATDHEAATTDFETAQVTILGGKDESETLDAAPPPPSPGGGEDDEFVASRPEHSTATAILEQLREQEADSDEEDVWLPPAGDETTTWTLPEMNQSPLGGTGPWEGVASSTQSGVDQPASEDNGDFVPPVFVSEAELRSQGPADTDDSGNWVPPTLRGMAPQAGNNADELPRRRRQPPQEP
jgi:hypothetical protein